ncbi:MAG: site-specific integrase [bacterium]
MAQIFERGGVWYARFAHNKKDYFRSTGVSVATESKKDAEEAKAAAEAELDRMLAEVRGSESVDALFARLTEAIAQLPKREQEPRRITLSERLRQGVSIRLPLADAWQAWLDNPKKRNPSPETVEMYRAYWGRDEVKKHGHRKVKNGFKNWLIKTHPEVTALHEVTPGLAEEYATHLWHSGIAPRTYNGAIKFLRSMFKVLRTRAALSGDVWEDIPAQENQTEGRRNLTTKELKSICGKAEGNLRYWLAIGLYTGLRLGDVVTLRWDEVDFDGHVIKRLPNKTRRKGKVITFPLHPVLETMLRELRAKEGAAAYLFPEDAELHAKGKSSAITNRIQDHFSACGIQTTERATSKHRSHAIVRVGFHSLRHSFVSLCAANRVPQVAIQELVGHGSPAMTALYTHSDDKQKGKAIAKLPSMTFESAGTTKGTERSGN